ncbi:MAG: hypothetical protein LC650_00545 [Actinobacteria bacterium]|nr:hypothetical protein [Actinomycetota bacterium]
MTKYIDTYGGKIAVDSMVGLTEEEAYVVDLAEVRKIMHDPSYMQGIAKQFVVADEDKFIDRLKESWRQRENPTLQ